MAGNCWECGGFDVEWMDKCTKHKGVEYCLGCECPYCEEEALERLEVEDEHYDHSN